MFFYSLFSKNQQLILNKLSLGVFVLFLSHLTSLGNDIKQLSDLVKTRYQHSSVTTNDGQVLIIGGNNSISVTNEFNAYSNYYKSIEVYNPNTNSWELKENILNHRRSDHQSILLNNGNILVFGGQKYETNNFTYQQNSEIINTSNLTSTLENIAPMNFKNIRPVWATFADGRVVTINGDSKCEIYNPESNSWDIIDSPNLHRGYSQYVQKPALVPLSSGSVLLIGGGSSKKMEILDPVTLKWEVIQTETLYHHENCKAQMMLDGKIFITGQSTLNFEPQSSELYDPSNGLIEPLTASPEIISEDIILTNNGNILAYDLGRMTTQDTKIIQIFDYQTRSWRSPITSIIGASGFSYSKTRNGSILITGGTIVPGQGCLSRVLSFQEENAGCSTSPLVNTTFNVCRGETVTFGTTGKSYAIIKNNREVNLTTGHTLKTNNLKDGTHILDLYEKTNCGISYNSTLTITVSSIQDVPDINSSGKNYFCSGENIEIEAYPNPLYTVNWSNAEKGNTIIVNSAGDFYAYYSDLNGCRSDNSSYLTILNGSNEINDFEFELEDEYCYLHGHVDVNAPFQPVDIYIDNALIRNTQFSTDSITQGNHTISTNVCNVTKEKSFYVDAPVNLNVFDYVILDTICGDTPGTKTITNINPSYNFDIYVNGVYSNKTYGVDEGIYASNYVDGQNLIELKLTTELPICGIEIESSKVDTILYYPKVRPLIAEQILESCEDGEFYIGIDNPNPNAKYWAVRTSESFYDDRNTSISYFDRYVRDNIQLHDATDTIHNAESSSLSFAVNSGPVDLYRSNIIVFTQLSQCISYQPFEMKLKSTRSELEQTAFLMVGDTIYPNATHIVDLSSPDSSRLFINNTPVYDNYVAHSAGTYNLEYKNYHHSKTACSHTNSLTAKVYDRFTDQIPAGSICDVDTITSSERHSEIFITKKDKVGNVYIVKKASGSSYGWGGIEVYDKNGTFSWRKTVFPEGSYPINSFISDIEFDSDGNIYIAGGVDAGYYKINGEAIYLERYDHYNYIPGWFVIKLNPIGQVLWHTTGAGNYRPAYLTSFEYGVFDLQMISDSTLLVLGKDMYSGKFADGQEKTMSYNCISLLKINLDGEYISHFAIPDPYDFIPEINVANNYAYYKQVRPANRIHIQKFHTSNNYHLLTNNNHTYYSKSRIYSYTINESGTSLASPTQIFEFNNTDNWSHSNYTLDSLDNIYLLRSDKKMIKYDVSTKQIVWEKELDQKFYFQDALTSISYIKENDEILISYRRPGDLIYDNHIIRPRNNSEGGLLCVNADNGSQNWHSDIDHFYNMEYDSFNKVYYFGHKVYYDKYIDGKYLKDGNISMIYYSPNSSCSELNYLDCNNTIDGLAYYDECGKCVGGTTNETPCVPTYDCTGKKFGDAFLDSCGQCVGGDTGLEPCIQDCDGVWGGYSWVNPCGDCGLWNWPDYGDCVQTCYGNYVKEELILNGQAASRDECGYCSGGITGIEPCFQDCNGDRDGIAYLDSCNNCVGGNTQQTACFKDCNGEWGGQAYLDSCQTCVSGSTGLEPCQKDCNGQFGGVAYLDQCDLCVSSLQDECIVSSTTTTAFKSVSIYPSPTTGLLYIISPEEANYSITNASGQKLIEGRVVQGKSSLDLSILPPGVYFTSINSENIQVIKKFVKK